MSHISTNEKASRTETLLRSLQLWDASAIVIGIIVGAGVFLVPRDVYLAAGSTGTALAIWVAGAVLSLCGVLLMAELGAMYPSAGGLYTYLRHAYGDLIGFLYGWTFFGLINAGALAGLLLAAGEYILPLGSVQAKKVVGVLLLTAFTLFNLRGIVIGKRLQNALTLAKVAGILLVAVILLGWSWTHPRPERLPLSASVGASQLAAGLVAVLWAFDGWAWVGFSAEEMRRPVRDLPRALVLGVSGVAVLYLGLCAAVYLTLQPGQLLNSERPVVDAVRQSFGPAAGLLVNGIVLVSIVGSMNGTILTGPRSLFALARDGYFFKSFAAVHRTFRTPSAAIYAQAIWAALLVWFADFNQLLNLVVFSAWLFYLLLGAAVPILRIRRPTEQRAFRIPAVSLVAAGFCFSALLVLGSLAVQQRTIVLNALLLIAAGIPLFFFFARLQRASGHMEPLE